MRRALVAGVLVLAGTLGPGTGTASAQTATTLTKVGDFASPIYVTAPPQDGSRLFVVERGGTIRIVRNGAKRKNPFLKFSVSTDGERGLLSMAFAPDYATSRRFYVFYTTPNGGDLRVDEYRSIKNQPNYADPFSRRKVIEIEHSAHGNHNGGQLQFGPDGHLYISTGDGGGGNDPNNNAQSTETLLGKILRINPRLSGSQPYTVPSGNPFVGTAGRDEIWSYGLRNPYRFSFDRGTGALTIGDVGQGRAEEVDYRSPTAPGGANFGWACFEGTQRTPNRPSCEAPNHVPPVFEYLHPDGGCSITGGYVARDTRLGSLLGRYLYADFCKGDIRSIELPSGSGDSSTGLSVPRPVSFGEDAAGCLYVASLDGAVSRIGPADRGPCTA